MTTPAAVRVVTDTEPETVAVIEHHDAPPVVVRHRPGTPSPWSCRTCGKQARPTCPHARAVLHTLAAWDALTEPTTEKETNP